MEYTAISDRLLIIQDPILPLRERAPWTGKVFSAGRSCKDVKQGDHIVFSPGSHPTQGPYHVIRAQQVYAIINDTDPRT